MQCPRCKSGELVPSEVERGLVGAGCESCHGVLISLINYRFWLDHHSPEDIRHDDSDVEVDESQQAKLCPKCSKLMVKYRIGLESTNRVELCSHCDEAWLDSGEWALLKRLDVLDHLPDIFTEAWQRNIRMKKQQAKWDEHFSNLIGEDDFSKVKAFKSWLDSHDKAADIKHFLLTRLN